MPKIETIGSFIENQYLPHTKARVRENTYNGYVSAIKCHILPRFANKIISQLTYSEVQAWIDEFEKPGAAKKAHKTLSQIMKYYIRVSGSTMIDPTKGIDLPKTETPEQEVFTPKETKLFLKGIRNHPYEAVCIIQLDLGLRKSEAFGVKWSDINFKTRLVKVDKSRQYIDGEEKIYPTKNKFSTRKVKLSRKYAKRLKKIYKKLGCPADNFVCTENPDIVSAQLKKYANERYLPWVPMKNFRHTFATNTIITRHASIHTIGRWLGHSNINMAYNRYIQMSDNNIDKLAKEIGR